MKKTGFYIIKDKFFEEKIEGIVLSKLFEDAAGE